MKKLFTLALCLILVSTNISFADTNNISVSTNISSASKADIQNAIKDIEMVNNSINIMIKKIVGDDPLETEELKKDIAFAETILGSQSSKISTLYSKESDFELRRTYSNILYTLSLYQLSLSSMLVYVNDTNKVDYFVDTCTSYSIGESSLKTLKSSNN
ncbi:MULTISPECIES: hypothetical protein [Terrisporobacter]|uniref:Uncharacterized protein n=1 Tax=Terrisporobacter othiniensis TaxID=1577792 RepID=A0A0B3VTQ7_9FIRM|nr:MULTISPECIES: hypothetical protein [Terrisporobacter]KHS56188.1 hypothetical protein QX51_15645 [Terrisporobacter othiniensis]MCC3668630.1 hypothetical protein [Terrisporobacter mayombei]MDU6984274.1 hypothetical protein [Terrisporobacter othiniensis]